MRYLLMFFILCGSLWAQDMSPQESGTANADSLLDQAITAAEEEYYQRALELLKQGQESFPLDSRFLSQRGDMLLDQGLNELALQNYVQALDLNPQGPQIIKQIALTLGYLDRNDDAVDYLLQLMDFESFREGAVEDLAWVYYKLHRLKQGETLLLQELESGFNRRMAHTLGTIYAGLYNYEESQRYYMESIDHALAEGQSYFASVAYYKLSI
ncbi:MAG: hypothetical protein PF447_00220 [Spirochaetaceae bacterium]|jgi:Flp pilus assembly protein TadD|nr:hypothetical protein [Spirochaetaceae bacterium]